MIVGMTANDSDIRDRRSDMKFLLLSFLMLASCSEYQIVEGTPIEPVLKLNVISIPNEGIVSRSEGEIFIKRQGSKLYTRLQPESKVGYGDILELRRGATVIIQLNGENSLTIKPVTEDSWFTFKKLDR
jgi:hypothetical protein